MSVFFVRLAIGGAKKKKKKKRDSSIHTREVGERILPAVPLYFGSGTPPLSVYTDQWLQATDQQKLSNSPIQHKSITGRIPFELSKFQSIYGQLDFAEILKMFSSVDSFA